MLYGIYALYLFMPQLGMYVGYICSVSMYGMYVEYVVM